MIHHTSHISPMACLVLLIRWFLAGSGVIWLFEGLGLERGVWLWEVNFLFCYNRNFPKRETITPYLTCLPDYKNQLLKCWNKNKLYLHIHITIYLSSFIYTIYRSVIHQPLQTLHMTNVVSHDCVLGSKLNWWLDYAHWSGGDLCNCLSNTELFTVFKVNNFQSLNNFE